jgi:hypothetical protein
MSDSEITAAALGDPDNPPPDADELARIAAAREGARGSDSQRATTLNSLKHQASTTVSRKPSALATFVIVASVGFPPGANPL